MEPATPSSPSQVNIIAFSSTIGGLLLPTVVAVYDVYGNFHQVKIILDFGSMSSFISDNLMEKLRLPQKPVDIQIEGITKSTIKIRSSCDISVQCMSSSYSFKANCLVIPKITSNLPAHVVRTDTRKIPDGTSLADPSFYYPSEVNMFLGRPTTFGTWYFPFCIIQG